MLYVLADPLLDLGSNSMQVHSSDYLGHQSSIQELSNFLHLCSLHRVLVPQGQSYLPEEIEMEKGELSLVEQRGHTFFHAFVLA